MRHTHHLFILLFLVTGSGAFAQEKDSLHSGAIKYVTDKFPLTRMFNAEFRYDAPYTYTSKLHGTLLPEAKVTQMYQGRISTNLNFVKTKKWMVGTGLFYNYIHAETEQSIHSGAADLHYYAAAVNVTYFSQLFGKMAIYTASAIPSGGNNGFERVTGLATATIVLKANAKTKMTLGVFVIADPTSVVPAALSFSYEHHFNNGWIADVILPKSVYMKKDMFKEGRLSIGTELDGTMFYLNNFNNDKKTYIYNQMELLSGIKYEHSFYKGLIGTLKTGYKYIPSSRVVEKNHMFSNYEFSAKPSGVFYVNVGLSYNP
ncbi:hypothetical protein ACLI1A_09275 [Flavobacterium sp. RHBU_3]|uniref:hypothetical protein n=1 Tax=Flavobacterium sp. RHBU_3 TaxID=3391184 RepID=UPI003984BF2A